MQLKKTISKLLPKDKFTRGVTILVGGTASSQLLLILAVPILTRLFTPEDFGVLAVYASLLSLISVVAGMRYELAIPLPEHDVDAANLVALSLSLVTFTSLVAGVLVVLLALPLADALGVPEIGGYLWLLPIGVLLAGFYKVFNYWAVRTKRFGTIATTRIRQVLAALLIQIVSFKIGTIALILGQVAGQSVGSLTLARQAFATQSFKQISWHGVREVALRYKRFPLFSSWEGFANTAGSQLPPLMFAAMFGPVAAGLYTLAHRVLSTPMSLIGSAIGQVFYSNAADAHRASKLGELVLQLHTRLAHIGLPPALLLLLLGPDLFALIFGEDWRKAGEFARWMTPWLYLVFVASPLSTLFAVTESQKQGLAFQLILLISRISAIAIGSWVGDLNITIILFVGVSSFCWLGFLFWVAFITGNTLRSIILPTVWAAGVGLLCSVPVLVFLGLYDNSGDLWLYAISLSLVLIGFRYWYLLRCAYK